MDGGGRMTLRHLRIFQTVCACKSITGAAEELNMSQPAVSMAIRELESFYRTPLFERLGRRIDLTEAGRTLTHYADTVLGGFEESVEALSHGEKAAKCRLGVNVSVGETILPRVLRALHAPEAVQVIIENTRAIERRLEENEIDLAILDGAFDSDRWTSRLVFTDGMQAVCAPALYGKDTIDVESLSHKRLLLREKGSASRRCVEAVLSRQGYDVYPAAESVSTLGLLALARAGLGFALVPESLELSGETQLKRIRVEEAAFARRYFILRHPKKHMTPLMQEIFDVVV